MIDSGRSRTPVATAERPRATERNSGTVKKRPACRRYWKKNAVSPPRNVMFRSSAGSMSALSPRATRWFSHARKRLSTTPPASTSHTTGDNPRSSGASGFGWTKPHVPERRIP